MGIQYFRPNTLEEALYLLNLPNTTPFSGGTHLTQESLISKDLIDLQDLGFDKIIAHDHEIEIGVSVKLQYLLESKYLPQSFQTAVQIEETFNKRNSASVGGLIITCDGRSSIITSLLAMKASIQILPGSESMDLEEFLKVRSKNNHKFLITSIILQKTKDFSFHYISRTRVDKPIICAALSILENGNKCLALGGYGKHPIIAYDDFNDEEISMAARNAYISAEDEWASAEYRSSMAEVLTKRCLLQLSSTFE